MRMRTRRKSRRSKREDPLPLPLPPPIRILHLRNQRPLEWIWIKKRRTLQQKQHLLAEDYLCQIITNNFITLFITLIHYLSFHPSANRIVSTLAERPYLIYLPTIFLRLFCISL